jgi:hypothetical protein
LHAHCEEHLGNTAIAGLRYCAYCAHFVRLQGMLAEQASINAGAGVDSGHRPHQGSTRRIRRHAAARQRDIGWRDLSCDAALSHRGFCFGYDPVKLPIACNLKKCTRAAQDVHIAGMHVSCMDAYYANQTRLQAILAGRAWRCAADQDGIGVAPALTSRSAMPLPISLPVSADRAWKPPAATFAYGDLRVFRAYGQDAREWFMHEFRVDFLNARFLNWSITRTSYEYKPCWQSPLGHGASRFHGHDFAPSHAP